MIREQGICFTNQNNVDLEYPDTRRLLPREVDEGLDLTGSDGFKGSGNRWAPVERIQPSLIEEFPSNIVSAHHAPLLYGGVSDFE